MSLEKFDKDGNIDPVYEYIEEITRESIKNMVREGKIRLNLKSYVDNSYSDRKFTITPVLEIDGEELYSGEDVDIVLRIAPLNTTVHSDVFIEKESFKNEVVKGHAIGRLDGNINIKFSDNKYY